VVTAGGAKIVLASVVLVIFLPALSIIQALQSGSLPTPVEI
jgi:hypothetical protein